MNKQSVIPQLNVSEDYVETMRDSPLSRHVNFFGIH